MQEREIKGITTELLCQAEFIKRNINVSVPISAYCKYDFVADINGKFYRIQVKHSNPRNDSFTISAKSAHLSSNGPVTRKYRTEDIDFFCTVFNNNCYLIPISEVEERTQITLTLDYETRAKTHYTMNASEYLLDLQLNLIKSGDVAKQKDYVIQKSDKNNEVVGTFKTERECAASCNVPNGQSHIHDCISGKRKSAYGFKWKKVEKQ